MFVSNNRDPFLLCGYTISIHASKYKVITRSNHSANGYVSMKSSENMPFQHKVTNHYFAKDTSSTTFKEVSLLSWCISVTNNKSSNSM